MPVGVVFMGKKVSYVMSQIRQNRALNLDLVHPGSCWLLKRHKIELQGTVGDQFVQENLIQTPKASLLFSK